MVSMELTRKLKLAFFESKKKEEEWSMMMKKKEEEWSEMRSRSGVDSRLMMSEVEREKKKMKRKIKVLEQVGE